ncbi:MAG: hypothetical protein PHC61_05390 [Chitinivibrionales bacterium]|nr:hypothetical protein [Chitinivibrionales bacterium]
MIFSTEADYRDGSVILKEKPDGVKRARLIVTFLSGKSGAVTLRRNRKTDMDAFLGKCHLNLGKYRFNREELYDR